MTDYIEVIPEDEAMIGTSLTLKGQVTVPKEVRDALKIGPGDKVFFVADGDRAIMVPIKGDIWSVRGALKRAARGKSLDWKEIRRQVRKAAVRRRALSGD